MPTTRTRREPFNGGRICLDFVAARPASAGLAGEWAYGARLVPSRPLVTLGPEWQSGLRELLEVLEVLITCQLAGTAPAPRVVAQLNRLAEAPPPAPRAVLGLDGTLTRALATPLDAHGLLAAVARDAVDLFTDPAARTQLRRCQGENCSLAYLDASRGRRRRWCSSTACGNRERVARHRRRTGARGTGQPTNSTTRGERS